MKKGYICLAFFLLLAGCGAGRGPEATPTPTKTPVTVATAAPSATETPVPPTETPTETPVPAPAAEAPQNWDVIMVALALQSSVADRMATSTATGVEAMGEGMANRALLAVIDEQLTNPFSGLAAEYAPTVRTYQEGLLAWLAGEGEPVTGIDATLEAYVLTLVDSGAVSRAEVEAVILRMQEGMAQ